VEESENGAAQRGILSSSWESLQLLRSGGAFRAKQYQKSENFFKRTSCAPQTTFPLDLRKRTPALGSARKSAAVMRLSLELAIQRYCEVEIFQLYVTLVHPAMWWNQHALSSLHTFMEPMLPHTLKVYTFLFSSVFFC
jgi:hypothetical protein